MPNFSFLQYLQISKAQFSFTERAVGAVCRRKGLKSSKQDA